MLGTLVFACHIKKPDTMNLDPSIESFLSGDCFAVVGASSDQAKYGNKVLRCYGQSGRRAIPINPKASEVEGIKAYATLEDVPHQIDCVSVITPPQVTESIVHQANAIGIKHIWMQPGAESELAVKSAENLGMNVIAGGPCLLVVLGYREK